MTEAFEKLTKRLQVFAQDRDWKQFHSPKNLAMALSVEASELLEHFQWNEDFVKEELADELADVALYLLQLASIAEIDLEQAMLDKLEVNDTREWD